MECKKEKLIVESERLQKLEEKISQGTKFDSEKPMMALLPVKAMEEEGKVWTFGAKKYDTFNWVKGISYLRILSAILRHTMALMAGQDIDSESGLHHAAHIRCCCAMLIEFHYSNRKELDDRYKENK